MNQLYLKYQILSKLINKKIKMIISNFNFKCRFRKFFLTKFRKCIKEMSSCQIFIFLKLYLIIVI